MTRRPKRNRCRGCCFGSCVVVLERAEALLTAGKSQSPTIAEVAMAKRENQTFTFKNEVVNMKQNAKCSVSISFAEVALPPFQDILILGRRCPHGKVGVSKCLNLLAPNDFELVEVEDSRVEAILVNKKILKRMPASKIVQVLKETVFPYITVGEVVKVDFKVTISYDNIEVKMGREQKHARQNPGSKNV